MAKQYKKNGFQKKRNYMSGLDDVQQYLKRFEALGEEGSKMVEDILMKAVEPAQKELVRTAPDDEPIQKNNEKYGKLKENIKLEYFPEYQMVYVTSGDAYWARMVEYGSRTRKKNPFFEKAYLAKKKEVEQNIIKLSKKKLGLK